MHFAAMLMFLHGKDDTAFDWSQPPLFLRFKTTNREEPAGLFGELYARIGMDPDDSPRDRAH